MLTWGTDMRRQAAALGAPAVLMLSACAGTTAPVAADSVPVTAHSVAASAGTVRGRYVMEGGPIDPGGSQPPARPLSGVVIFQDRDAKVSVRAGKTGRFSVRLPAGSYTVSGRSPSIREQLPDGHVIEGRCSVPLRVSVHAGQTARITVLCAVP
jgi:hypothetical protein